MASWRDRLCGTIALRSVNQTEPDVTVTQINNPSEIMSCGGVWCKANQNDANMKTFKSNFVLPTENYSIMIFNKDGNAVIFSDGESLSGQTEPDSASEEDIGSSKYLN